MVKIALPTYKYFHEKEGFMRYRPPKQKDQEQWVPIVVKNKDWLIGYISGIQMVESLVIESLEDNGFDINLKGIDICLDSSRFNDILENGKRESKCTKEEIKNYYKEIIEEKIDSMKDEHPNNGEEIFSDCFLEVECVCGLGVYIFNTPEEVPSEQFKCQICGRVIIDYTEHNDEEFDYDGSLNSRVGNIIDELTKNYQKELNEEDDDEDEEDLF